MNANVDLRQLAVRRGEAASPAPVRRSRHLATRYLLPGAVLLGFVAVVGWAARDSLLPSRSVTVVPVITTRMEVRTEGTPLFQSAGWIEPRPTPILVTALAEGVVDKLLVVEGQEVKAGDKVALLIRTDAVLALEAVEAERDLRLAELEFARVVLKAAQTNVEKPVNLQAGLAEAQAMLAQKDTELAALPFQINGGRARLLLAKQSYEGKKQAAMSGALPEIVLNQAKSEFDAAEAAVAELESRKGKLQEEVTAQRRRRDSLKERLDLKIDETRLAGEAEANVKSAAARLKQTEVLVATAKLRLERTVITAPADGQVLALVARPGYRLMGQSQLGQQEASTVITMFDPAMLQVRADVRLEDVPRVQRGQAAKIETPAAPGGPLVGEVLQITSQADIQKNTLQVKVVIKSPPATLRPDMLVQVTFLAPPSAGISDTSKQALRLLISPQLVESGDSGPHVWVADLANKAARKQPVKLGRSSGELVEVIEGLNPADRLISGGRQDLRDGQRINVTGEDAGPGVAGNESAAKPKRLPTTAAKDGSGKQ